MIIIYTHGQQRGVFRHQFRELTISKPALNNFQKKASGSYKNINREGFFLKLFCYITITFRDIFPSRKLFIQTNAITLHKRFINNKFTFLLASFLIMVSPNRHNINRHCERCFAKYCLIFLYLFWQKCIQHSFK